MSDEIRMWRIGPGKSLSAIQRTPLDLEQRLQEWLARDISVLDPALLVIGREVETDFGGFIDLLCIDPLGDLVVVELKRDKTPREITAQVLDYASWVVDLSHERITSIAQDYLAGKDLEHAFKVRFGNPLPETVNSAHRMMIVGSVIDASSERIIRYLSDHHGVNINAATFQYFREQNGSEILARVFLMEPESVEFHSRTQGSSKRRPNLTYEELLSIAKKKGVEDLYSYAVAQFEQALKRLTTRSSIGFAGQFEGSRNNVISLIPGESNSNEGLRYQIYKRRFGTLTGLSLAEVEARMPTDHSNWIYYGAAGPDYEGFQGFIVSRAEVDRLAEVLQEPQEGPV